MEAGTLLAGVEGVCYLPFTGRGGRLQSGQKKLPVEPEVVRDNAWGGSLGCTKMPCCVGPAPGMGTNTGKYFSPTLPRLMLQLEITLEASLNNNNKKLSSLKIITKIKPLCFTQAGFSSPPSMVHGGS